MASQKQEVQQDKIALTQDFLAERKNQSVHDRVAFALETNYGLSDVKKGALNTLASGLSVKGKAKLCAGLVKANWQTLKGGNQEATFLRKQSLYKDAMMAPLLDRLKDNNKDLQQFKTDPVRYVERFEFNEQISAVLSEIVNHKLDQGESIQEFAHNIVFSAITGPMLSAEKTPEMMQAVKMLGNSNRVLCSTQDLSDLPDQEITTPMLVENYVNALDSMLCNISNQYQPGQIREEQRVSENLHTYHDLRAHRSDKALENIFHRFKTAIKPRGDKASKIDFSDDNHASHHSRKKRGGDEVSRDVSQNKSKRPKSIKFIREGVQEQKQIKDNQKENTERAENDRPSGPIMGGHRRS